jgi:Major tropism determinant N-terminal domain
MPLQLQFRRGTAAQNNAFTGVSGELAVDTDNKTIRVHDGSTAGGITVVNVNATQTLTNKTLVTPVIAAISNNSATITIPGTTDTLVARNTTDTLTNKTLTSPVISTITNSGTLTLPTSTDTLVGRATTDTLTNKTLTAPNITGGSYKYIIGGQSLAANRTILFPIIASDDVFTLNAATQTLTNKTLTSPYITDATLSGVVNGNVTFQGNIQSAYTPIVGYDVPNKIYVDTKALTTAIAIAAALA